MLTCFFSLSMYLRELIHFRMFIYFFGLRIYLTEKQGLSHSVAHTGACQY
jgi:hypothetical protein